MSNALQTHDWPQLATSAMRYWKAKPQFPYSTMKALYVQPQRLEQSEWSTILAAIEIDEGVELAAESLAATRGGKKSKAKPPAPDFGPGTEATAICAMIGFAVTAECDCKKKAAMMNAWGVAGCRRNFWTIVGWFKDRAARLTWKQWRSAAWLFFRSGLAFRVNWLRGPCVAIVDAAIRQATKARGS